MSIQFVLALSTLFSFNVFAAKPNTSFSNTVTRMALPACDHEVITSSNKMELTAGLKGIPQGVLVAREARFYVESRTDNGTLAKIEAYQSFVKAKKSVKSKVVCASAESPLKNRFSMMAPTLINNQGGQKVQNIFWQFQVMAENSMLSTWNTKSIALSASDDLDKTLRQLGYESKVFQLSSNRYQIIYTQKLPDKKQTLSVTYDLD